MFYVYLLSSKRNGTLYVGMTSDLAKRVWEHKAKAMPGFTARYAVDKLVWYETHDNAEAAIRREKQMKEWRRSWKVSLIEAQNQDWLDVFFFDPLTRRPGESRDPYPPWIPAFAGMTEEALQVTSPLRAATGG